MPLPADELQCSGSLRRFAVQGGVDSKEHLYFAELQEKLAQCVGQNDCEALSVLLDSVRNSHTRMRLLNTPIPRRMWEKYE